MRENPDNRVRLFCFHHAGGSAVLFADWYKYLIPAVGIYPMQMKRRTADGSAPFHSIREAAETFAAWIRHYSDRPVYFFGHSMGGVLAFCTAEILERQYGIRAVRLFASASVPDLGVRGADAKSRISELPDPLFLEFLKGAGGVDGKTLEAKEFYRYFLPVIRSDYQLLEEYIPEGNVTCDVDVFYGCQDMLAPEERVKNWNRYTTGKVRYFPMPGGHFFLHSCINKICGQINESAGSAV
jgi:medium-chain acyl-[acyl-carrier-protein] hydrolase